MFSGCPCVRACVRAEASLTGLPSGVTSHRQPRQYRRAQGPKTVKGAQSDPNYVSRLLLDCVRVFHKIITPAYLLCRSGPVAIYYSEIYSLCCGYGHTVTSSLSTLFVSRWTRARSKCLPGGGKNYSYATDSVHAMLIDAQSPDNKNSRIFPKNFTLLLPALLVLLLLS